MTPQIEQRKITDFQPDPANANKGTERGLRALDDSLSEVGLGRSIVTDRNGVVIAGNKTQERAVDQGFENALVVHTDGSQLVVVQRDDLDLSAGDGKARKLAYYDNRVGQLSLDWDAQQILADLDAGFDFDGLFAEDELDDLLKGLREKAEDPGPQGDPELLKKWGVQRGDLWQISPHRLLCGDSTNTDNAARITEGLQDYVFYCDPFFGDNLIATLHDLYSFEHALFLTGGKQLRDILALVDHFHEGVLLGCACIPQMGNPQKLMYEHKVIVWTSKTIRFEAGYSSVVQSEEGAERKYGDVYHHTSKPVDAVARILEPFTQTNVVDAFAGLGSGFAACERLGRRCHGIELEPAHCAGILERLSQMGLAPERAV